MYATSDTTLLHIKRIYKTESQVFCFVGVLCFQKQPFRFLLNAHAQAKFARRQVQFQAVFPSDLIQLTSEAWEKTFKKSGKSHDIWEVTQYMDEKSDELKSIQNYMQSTMGDGDKHVAAKVLLISDKQKHTYFPGNSLQQQTHYHHRSHFYRYKYNQLLCHSEGNLHQDRNIHWCFLGYTFPREVCLKENQHL